MSAPALNKPTLEKNIEALRAAKQQLAQFRREEIGEVAYDRITEAITRIQRAIDHCRTEIHALAIHDGGQFTADGR